jgi:hypothetical protein
MDDLNKLEPNILAEEKILINSLNKKGVFIDENFIKQNLIVLYHSIEDNVNDSFVYNHYIVWADRVKDEFYTYLFEINIKKDGSMGDLSYVKVEKYNSLYEMESRITEADERILFNMAKEFSLKRKNQLLNNELKEKEKSTIINKV